MDISPRTCICGILSQLPPTLRSLSPSYCTPGVFTRSFAPEKIGPGMWWMGAETQIQSFLQVNNNWSGCWFQHDVGHDEIIWHEIFGYKNCLKYITYIKKHTHHFFLGEFCYVSTEPTMVFDQLSFGVMLPTRRKMFIVESGGWNHCFTSVETMWGQAPCLAKYS